MKKYIGTKTIQAEPAVKDGREGYRVIYPDGYESWSPKEVFEEAYHELLLTEGEPFPLDAKLQSPVFPSNKITIAARGGDEYGGAHEYHFQNCTGFNNGETGYHNSFQRIQFVKKESDGSMTPGLQSEQLLIALIDRHKKLNNAFPSREGALAITKMEEALLWLNARVKERIDRGVMGKLEK